MMTKKIVTIATLIALLLTSCGGMANKQGTEETKTTESVEHNAVNIEEKTQKEDMSTWWVGKHFESNRSVGQNPEEGGADFLIIKQDQTASYKVGDIIDEMTWKTNGATLIVKNKMAEREIIFKIGDSFLTDSYGTKWTVKR